ncbi:hypothetical protein [Pseudooceanicola nitratireducens]|uniref:hypothetical protein n=1 Tax=Pseudooceanicola nitratireducens TaxID=517719 RepID=UPI0023F24645|nr:hypothetical protein [Pseudooceanicola nitratireducens]
METTLRKFEREMERGRQAAVKSATVSEQAWKRAGNQMAANANRAASGLERVTKISGAGRFVLQNTASQIGDIAVQLEGGTAASRVMAQQLPQLLGGFGALGGVLGVVAPLLGTIAAVGIPAVAMFWNMSEGADEASKKVESFADKVADAESALGRAESAMHSATSSGLDDLLQKYGEVTEAVRELAQELLDIEIRAAKVEVGEVIDAALGADFKAQIDELFGGIGSAIIAPDLEGINAAKETVRELQTEVQTLRANNQSVPFALTEDLRMAKEELAALQGDFENASELISQMKLSPDLAKQIAEAERAIKSAFAAGDFGATASGLDLIRDLLQQVGGSLEQDVLDRLSLAEDAALRMEKTMRDTGDAAKDVAEASSGIAGALTPAIDGAAALARNFGIALSAARAIELRAYNSSIGGGRSMGRGGPTADEIQKYDPAAQLAYQPGGSAGVPLPTPSKSRGSRGSSRSEGFDALETGRQQLENMQRQIEMLGKSSSEVAVLTAKYRALDAAKKAGIDVDSTLTASGKTLRQEIEAQAESIGHLSTEYDQAKEHMRAMEDLQGDLKSAILDMAAGGEGAMKRLGEAIKRAALEALLFNEGPLSGIFGGKRGSGGGIFGSLISGIFGGFRADGGPVQAGKTYVTGERGPELFTPSTSGFITPNHELGQTGGGGVLEVRLGPGLEAEWLAKSGMQSVQISTSAARSQQRALGGNISAYQARGTTG